MKKTLLTLTLFLGMGAAVIPAIAFEKPKHDCGHPCDTDPKNNCCTGNNDDGSAWSVTGIHRVTND
ncbi:MAG TPA: hypothetical protein VF421_11175 [Niabella sp.]